MYRPPRMISYSSSFIQQKKAKIKEEIIHEEVKNAKQQRWESLVIVPCLDAKGKRESDVGGIICFPPMSFKSKLTNQRGPSGKLIKLELGRDHLGAGGRLSWKSKDTSSSCWFLWFCCSKVAVLVNRMARGEERWGGAGEGCRQCYRCDFGRC